MVTERHDGVGPRHVHNGNTGSDLPASALELLDEREIATAIREISSWPGYAPTPLIRLGGLAGRLGVEAVLYKDEGQRFGLHSFKALGGAYAVLSILKNKLRARGIAASVDDLIGGKFRDQIGHETVVCATDGNHGRSVAWGASLFGCNCRIYVHENVSTDRTEAIEAFGAVIVRTKGEYDDSVRTCARDAAKHGWTLVADTNAGGGPPEVPRLVMQGYTVIVSELLKQLDRPPTHVFIPAGVGGLAAAVAGYWARTAGARRPRMVVVEPHSANCVFEAIRLGQPKPVTGNTNSFMACLAAGEVSPIAWPTLHKTIDDVLTICDEVAARTMRELAEGAYGDRPVISGESGCAAVAALVAVGGDKALRDALGINSGSRILTIGSEGATAPVIWERVVGKPPASFVETA